MCISLPVMSSGNPDDMPAEIRFSQNRREDRSVCRSLLYSKGRGNQGLFAQFPVYIHAGKGAVYRADDNDEGKVTDKMHRDRAGAD